jgi:hypothetical protein
MSDNMPEPRLPCITTKENQRESTCLSLHTDRKNRQLSAIMRERLHKKKMYVLPEIGNYAIGTVSIVYYLCATKTVPF